MATVSEPMPFESSALNISGTTPLKLSGNWTCFFSTVVGRTGGFNGVLFIASKSEWMRDREGEKGREREKEKDG